MIESFIWKGKQILIDFLDFLTKGPHLFSIITNNKYKRGVVAGHNKFLTNYTYNIP